MLKNGWSKKEYSIMNGSQEKPSPDQRTIFISECEQRVPAPLSPYRSYLSGRGVFGRIADLGFRSGWTTISDYEGMRVVDLAGGTVDVVDNNSTQKPMFYPWFGAAMHLLGSNVTLVDRHPLPNPVTILEPRLRGLVRAFRSMMDDVGMDLSHELSRNPTSLAEKLRARVPWLRSGVDILNMRMVISFGENMSVNAPSFLRSLGVKTDEQGMPLGDPEGRQKIHAAYHGVFSAAHALLVEGGFLWFNDVVFKKVGDSFVFVPDARARVAQQALEDLKQQGHGFAIPPGVRLSVRWDHGNLKINFGTHSDLEPVP